MYDNTYATAAATALGHNTMDSSSVLVIITIK